MKVVGNREPGSNSRECAHINTYFNNVFALREFTTNWLDAKEYVRNIAHSIYVHIVLIECEMKCIMKRMGVAAKKTLYSIVVVGKLVLLVPTNHLQKQTTRTKKSDLVV